MSDRRISHAVSLFGLFLLVAMALSLWLSWQVAEEVMYEQMPVNAAGLVDQLLLRVHWQGLETFTEQLWQERAGELMTELAGRLDESDQQATFLYRPDAPQYPASGPGRAANQFETDLMAQFMLPQAEGQEQPTVVGAYSLDNTRYDYYEPIYAKRSCTGACHGAASPGGVFVDRDNTRTAPLAAGDLMAVAKISLSNVELRQAANTTWSWLLAVTIFTTCLVMLAFYIAIRHVMKLPAQADPTSNT